VRPLPPRADRDHEDEHLLAMRALEDRSALPQVPATPGPGLLRVRAARGRRSRSRRAQRRSV